MIQMNVYILQRSYSHKLSLPLLYGRNNSNVPITSHYPQATATVLASEQNSVDFLQEEVCLNLTYKPEVFNL